jgi:hypothetical protein
MKKETLKKKILDNKAFAKIKDLFNYGEPTPTPKPTPKPDPCNPRSPDWGDWCDPDRDPDRGRRD